MVGDDGGDNQIGMAPGAKWMAAKGCESSSCSQSALLSSGQFILAPTNLQGQNPNPALRPHVMNNSLTCPPRVGCAAGTLESIVNNTTAAGIFVEASAGNAGSTRPSPRTG